MSETKFAEEDGETMMDFIHDREARGEDLIFRKVKDEVDDE